jgi:hypothetical protein
MREQEMNVTNVNPENGYPSDVNDKIAKICGVFVEKAGDPLWEKCLTRVATEYGTEARNAVDNPFIKLIFQSGLMSGFANAVTTAGEIEVASQAMEKQDDEMTEAIGDVFNHILSQPTEQDKD